MNEDALESVLRLRILAYYLGENQNSLKGLLWGGPNLIIVQRTRSAFLQRVKILLKAARTVADNPETKLIF